MAFRFPEARLGSSAGALEGAAAVSAPGSQAGAEADGCSLAEANSAAAASAPSSAHGGEEEASPCSGLWGAAVGSTRTGLRPRGPCACGGYEADTRTAGSCTLMVQVALPCLLFAQPRCAPDPDPPS